VSRQTATIVALLVGWEITSWFFSPLVFPGLARVGSALVQVITGGARFDPLEHLPVTLARMALGYAVAMIVGTVFGVLMGVSDRWERLLLTPTLVLLTAPAVVLAFILLSWLGLTTYAVPVLTISLVIIPFVTIHIWEGTKDVDMELVEMARSFGVGRRQLFLEVYLPQLHPYLFSTLRHAFPIAWKIVLIAELFGTNSGIGFAINYYFTTESIGLVVAWALPVIVMVYAFMWALRECERRLLTWQPPEDREMLGEVVQ